ncbi:hypothetical protein ABZX69_01655 [Streptomyces sp. NPDC004074]|uniref:hypothetical protein n=1 Tax=unclassified Streptomyces TaxID=2593676 RepID=UPI0033B51BE6
MGAVAVVVALPLAVASAGSVGEGDQDVIRTPVPEEEKRPVSVHSPQPGPGLTTAAHCGPQLSSVDGIEAQTCVMTQGREAWARTYYRNATGQELRSVLSFMGPNGRSVQIHCVVAAGDDPESCETPRRPLAGEAIAYSAVAEFAADDGEGPLLLRSGSEVGAHGL